MRPQHLKYPFRFEERTILLKDQMLFIPRAWTDPSVWTFPGWAAAEIFGNDNPVVIEYCSGNGDWIVEQAVAHPHKNFVAVEIRFDRIRKIWSKRGNATLSNLMIVCCDAQRFTRWYVPSETVSEVYVNFPDPWPKLRHAKHRLMQEPFISDVHRSLKSDGTFTLATDDVTYSEGAMAVMNGHDGFVSAHPEGYVDTHPSYGNSYFERLFRSQGLSIRYHCYHSHHLARQS